MKKRHFVKIGLLVVAAALAQDAWSGCGCCRKLKQYSRSSRKTTHSTNKTLGASSISSNQRLECTVAKVISGDTICVKRGNNSAEVRLDRIEAPEIDQEYGDVAAKALGKKIRGKSVVVEWKKRDPGGRILGIVKLNGEDVNLWMVKEGHAWHYDHFDRTPAYAEAHKSAKEAGLGLWAGKNPVHPYDWRKTNKKTYSRW